MALYVVRHQHAPAQCPAQDPELGALLLNHLSRPSVRRYGVEIKGEAVVHGEHTLYLIVEAADEASVRALLVPFESAGRVDVYAASTCARVVASGGCTAMLPAHAPGPAVDPEEACQQAIEAGLLVHRAHPLNGETSIPALIGAVVTPNAHFYVRNHFEIPDLEASQFRLSVGGLVERPLNLSLRDLRDMPSQTTVLTLECAGNGRTMFDPPVDGEKWRIGAVSTAEWTGVPLAAVLDRAGVAAPAREVLFQGADSGIVSGRSNVTRFERSLRLDRAREAGALLAYAMNGESLPTQHGHPLRLVVPGWYAVASVKWLTSIQLVADSFDGYFQSEKYWYEPEQEGSVREPVTLQRVRALITDPAPDQQVSRGQVTVRGVAWSGTAPIASVQVSVDDGTWEEARILGESRPHRWQWWELMTSINRSGRAILRARATDQAGQTQPIRATRNRLGYGNNSIQEMPIWVM